MHRLLAAAGLPVPEFEVFTLDDLGAALAFLGSHPAGCVVKPSDGTAAGDGVSTHLRTANEVRDAAVLASLYGDELLIEPQVGGECYRVLVVGGEAVHAVCRQGPRLVGDGHRTVRELIADSSSERAGRGRRPLNLDREAEFTLGWQGLGPDSVPEEGRSWIPTTIDDPLAAHGELRTVYNTDVTEDVDPSILRAAEGAAAVLGSDFVGVDLILLDSSRPADETGGVINEVNTTPALHHHYDAESEQFPVIALQVLELAFTRAERGREQEI